MSVHQTKLAKATRSSLVRLLLLASLVGAGGAGEALPYGHPDFYPGPERPIGYRGDGNGYFPGARPVLEFREGTMVEKERSYTHKGRDKVGSYFDIVDEESVNVVWKTEMPSWANSQPIVVGDKVFTIGEPDWLICTSARTGEVLWAHRSRVWDSLVDDPELADRLSTMFDIYLALGAIIDGQFKDRQPLLPPTEYRPVRDAIAEHCLPRMIAGLQRADPEADYRSPAEGVIAALDSFLADAGNYKQAKGMLEGRNSLRSTLKKRIDQLAGTSVSIDLPWGNMIGWCSSTPISDGERVYASFGQGQLVCFDLEGNRLWQRWMEPTNGRTDPLQSPMLRGEVLVDIHGGSKHLTGVDVRTGRALWQAPTRSDRLERHKGGYYVGSHKILPLRNEAGEEMDVVVTTLCNIIRLRDGKVVGHLPWPWNYGPSGGPSIFNCGDVVYRSANGDGGGCPFTAWRLELVDADTVRAEVIWHLGEKGSPGYQGQIATGTHLLMTNTDHAVVDGLTGEILVEGRRRHEDLGELSNVLAGHHWIWAEQGHRTRFWSYWGRRRFDGEVALRFHVADCSDLANPERLATVNVLGGENVPRFPAYEHWLKELYDARLLWGSWNGLPAHFMHVDTGILPHGDRLFIRSVSHLYCIGDPRKSWHTPAAAPPAARVPAD